jgi:lambda repressor-like predicted transcriptional regulator
MTERQRDERDLAILDDRKRGLTINQLSKKYGLARATIGRLLKETAP